MDEQKNTKEVVIGSQKNSSTKNQSVTPQINYSLLKFPLRLFLFYITFSIMVMVLLRWISIELSVELASKKWSDCRNVGELIIFVLGYVIAYGLFIGVFYFCKFLFSKLVKLFLGYKIYGINKLYFIANVISIVSILTFVGIIIFMIMNNIAFTFFDFFTHLFIFGVFLSFKFCMDFGLLSETCWNCGGVNTLKFVDRKEEYLGKDHKFHNEGGYYRDVHSSGSITDDDYNRLNIETKTKQYIPNQVVYDGVYEYTKVKTFYKCMVCGKIHTVEENKQRRLY